MGESFKTDGKALLAFFIGAIITVVFLGSIADSIFTQTNTFNFTNNTVTAPATNASLTLVGRQVLAGTTPIVSNSTNTSQLNLQDLGVFVETGTVNGLRTVRLTVNQTGNAFAGTSVNVTYEYEPDGYLRSSADRSIINLVILFGALAILVFGLVVLHKTGSLGKLIGRSK